MPRGTKKAFLLCAAFLLTAYISLVTAHAQTSGAVKGKIRNMAGDNIASASITARQNSKDVKSVTAGSKGEFLLDGLEPGVYNIVFEAKGYSSGIRYSVEVKSGKKVDLGERLIMQIDRGSLVVIHGSVFFKDGTSVIGAEVKIEKISADGSVKKIGTAMTNLSGEFTFRQPDAAAKFRMTAKYKDITVTKELEVGSAAIYRTAISLPIDRESK